MVTLESNLKDHKLKMNAEVLEAVNGLLSFVATPVVAANHSDGHINDGHSTMPQPPEADSRLTRIVVRPCHKHMLPKILDNANRGCDITLQTVCHNETIVMLPATLTQQGPFSLKMDTMNLSRQDSFLDQMRQPMSSPLAALASKGRDQLRAFVASVRGQKGAEQVAHVVLFEIHAHHFLQDSDPGEKVNICVVQEDGKNKSGHSTATIQTDGVVEFKSQETDGVTEVAGESKLMPGTCIVPASSAFPTCDAAVVVPGSTVGLDDHERLALLSQMTISGATSLL